MVARALGNTTKADIAFQAARERAAAAVRQRPDDPKALIALAQSDAELGRKEDAIREAERATQLLPVEKDVMNGTQLLIKLTGIYAQTGEIDRAINLLEQMAHNPGGASYISYRFAQARSRVGSAARQSTFRQDRCRAGSQQLAHQGNQPTTAGDFELAENRVNVFFHRRQTRTSFIGDLLIALPIADKLDDFTFPSR